MAKPIAIKGKPSWRAWAQEQADAAGISLTAWARNRVYRGCPGFKPERPVGR